ncbi:hypothetical protein Ato02nite_017950 [Paractinoplanes toevensis]|uniref:Uncharacterized protein n=1 Tax=Paractinoplanes toevensis TaxID=571911 RepID=A0A919VZD2_9ACTN|nr:hypothetical protein Ato02nite_017950 [Actinoplanes toevensis]
MPLPSITAKKAKLPFRTAPGDPGTLLVRSMSVNGSKRSFGKVRPICHVDIIVYNDNPTSRPGDPRRALPAVGIQPSRPTCCLDHYGQAPEGRQPFGHYSLGSVIF